MDTQFSTGLIWFRRDLRVDDNAALYRALKACEQVHCVFIFDTDILDPLPRADRRVEFLVDTVKELDENIRKVSGNRKSGLIVRHAASADEIPKLAHELHAQAVFANHDYEPSAIERDAKVRGVLANAGVAFHTYKDQVIFEKEELLTQGGKPYAVFTPYKNAWLKKVDSFFLQPYPVEKYAKAIANRPEAMSHIPSLSDLDFESTNLHDLKIPPGAKGALELFEDFFERIDQYDEARNFPAVKGPSYMGVHLRFGTVSIRRLAGTAQQLSIQGSRGAQTWLSELIWRDFYFQVLANNPRVVGHAFKPEYDAIKWEHGKRGNALFKAWCDGETGYPLVDAAMAQINQTGYMHNRLRMVVASFLTKDLGIDWRWGEKYFAEKLNDFDLSANNGGWQWASSSGCDAQPYFRIFNPVSQSKKFDAEGKFIRKYIPALAGLSDDAIHEPWTASPVELVAAGLELGKQYPERIVDHDVARKDTMLRYAVVKKSLDKSDA